MVVSTPVRPRSLPNTDDTEETRAFLQARVALFWKVIFFLTLFGSCLGLIGAIKAPGVDLAHHAATVRPGQHLVVALPERRTVHSVLANRRSLRIHRPRDHGCRPGAFPVGRRGQGSCHRELRTARR